MRVDGERAASKTHNCLRHSSANIIQHRHTHFKPDGAAPSGADGNSARNWPICCSDISSEHSGFEHFGSLCVNCDFTRRTRKVDSVASDSSRCQTGPRKSKHSLRAMAQCFGRMRRVKRICDVSVPSEGNFFWSPRRYLSTLVLMHSMSSTTRFVSCLRFSRNASVCECISPYVIAGVGATSRRP